MGIETINIDKASVIRCVNCGNRILEGIRGHYEDDKQCERCGTKYHIKLDRTDYSITYDTSEYEELER